MTTKVSVDFSTEVEIELDLEKYRKDIERRVNERIEAEAETLWKTAAYKIQMVAFRQIENRIEATVAAIIDSIVRQLMDTDEMREKLQQLVDRKVSE